MRITDTKGVVPRWELHHSSTFILLPVQIQTQFNISYGEKLGINNVYWFTKMTSNINMNFFFFFFTVKHAKPGTLPTRALHSNKSIIALYIISTNIWAIPKACFSRIAAHLIHQILFGWRWIFVHRHFHTRVDNVPTL